MRPRTYEEIAEEADRLRRRIALLSRRVEEDNLSPEDFNRWHRQLLRETHRLAEELLRLINSDT